MPIPENVEAGQDHIAVDPERNNTRVNAIFPTAELEELKAF
jgi:hypothetical protein